MSRTDSKLFKQYQQQPSIALRNRIVEQHWDLVRQVARRFCKTNEEREDLELVGVEELIKAVERFDPSTHQNFYGYAAVYVRGAMLDYLGRDGSLMPLPRPLRDRVRLYRRTEKELSQQLGRSPRQAELMTALRLSSQAYADLQQAMTAVGSLDTPLVASSSFTRLETIAYQPQTAPAPYRPTPEQAAQWRQLQATLNQLPEPIRQVLQWEYTGEALGGKAEALLQQLPIEQRQYVNEATELLRRSVAKEPFLDTATLATWKDSGVVLHMVEAAIDRLYQRKQPIHPTAVAREAKVECGALWHQHKALRRVCTDPANDVKARVEAAIQQLAGQPITLKLVAQKAGIPQMIVRRYPSLVWQIQRMEKTRKQVARQKKVRGLAAGAAP